MTIKKLKYTITEKTEIDLILVQFLSNFPYYTSLQTAFFLSKQVASALLQSSMHLTVYSYAVAVMTSLLRFSTHKTQYSFVT